MNKFLKTFVYGIVLVLSAAAPAGAAASNAAATGANAASAAAAAASAAAAAAPATAAGAAAQAAADISDFAVQESERDGETIELVALDASGDTRTKLTGAFPFSINGFETEMKFESGRAFFSREVAASTFLYLKQGGGNSGPAHLYYVYRGLAGGFTVIHIPLALLVIIPLALIVLGMFFRRLIILMLLLLGAFFYFNSSKGLSLESFFDAAKEWISSLL